MENGMNSNEHNGGMVTKSGASFEPTSTVEEAAEFLRIHPKTLQKLARVGQVPCIRMGKYWRFYLSSLDAWVRSNENHFSQPFRVKKSGENLEIQT
jgi:excisionase family DNA binding protein